MQKNNPVSLEKDYELKFYHYNGLPPAGPRTVTINISRKVINNQNADQDNKDIIV
jgi:hypothetical protein